MGGADGVADVVGPIEAVEAVGRAGAVGSVVAEGRSTVGGVGATDVCAAAGSFAGTSGTAVGSGVEGAAASALLRPGRSEDNSERHPDVGAGAGVGAAAGTGARAGTDTVPDAGSVDAGVAGAAGADPSKASGGRVGASGGNALASDATGARGSAAGGIDADVEGSAWVGFLRLRKPNMSRCGLRAHMEVRQDAVPSATTNPAPWGGPGFGDNSSRWAPFTPRTPDRLLSHRPGLR